MVSLRCPNSALSVQSQDNLFVPCSVGVQVEGVRWVIIVIRTQNKVEQREKAKRPACKNAAVLALGLFSKSNVLWLKLQNSQF